MDMNIIHGYSENELKKLPDNSVDMVFTSPPYADRRKNTYGGIPEDKYIEWFKPIAIEIKRVLKPTGSFFLNIKPHTNKGERSLYVFDLVLFLKRELGFWFVEEYCWTKNAFPGGLKGRFKNASSGSVQDSGFATFGFNGSNNLFFTKATISLANVIEASISSLRIETLSILQPIGMPSALATFVSSL